MIDEKTQLRLQPATNSDLNFIQQCLAQNQLPSSDLSTVLNKLFLVYANSEADSKIVGIGGIEDYGNCGLLRSIVVLEGLRGKGYGRVLCQVLLDYAQSQGIQTLYLFTITADAFFEKIGFARVERQTAPDVLQQTSEFSQLCPGTAICMRRTL